MSRSGYTDDYDDDQWAMIRWRGAVNSAIRGARGQAFLRELAAALDAMPEKELTAGAFQTADGEFCTLGVVAAARGADVSSVDPDDDYGCREQIAALLDIAPALAAEIMWENDEAIAAWEKNKTNADRWAYMRKWVGNQIREEASNE